MKICKYANIDPVEVKTEDQVRLIKELNSKISDISLDVEEPVFDSKLWEDSQ